jgi:hypothetical protein
VDGAKMLGTSAIMANEVFVANIQPLKLSSGVLKDEAALDAWWAAERQKLAASLQNGPIQIN